MLLVIVCGALLAVAVALCVVWGREPLVEPEIPRSPTSAPRPTTSRVRRHLDGLRLYAWWASMFLVVGTVSGLLVTGAGGRLAMRLLAVTSPQATGRLTEAQATVGEITFEGTIGFLVFGALPFAFASTALYLLAAPWLPRGRLAGPTFGLAAFIMVAPFIDPLRADNVDFDIVGPGWLSVLVFAALAVRAGRVPRRVRRPVEPEPPAHDAGELARHRPAAPARGRAVPARRGPRGRSRSSRSPCPASCPGSSPSAPHAAG